MTLFFRKVKSLYAGIYYWLSRSNWMFLTKYLNQFKIQLSIRRRKFHHQLFDKDVVVNSKPIRTTFLSILCAVSVVSVIYSPLSCIAQRSERSANPFPPRFLIDLCDCVFIEPLRALEICGSSIQCGIYYTHPT